MYPKESPHFSHFLRLASQTVFTQGLQRLPPRCGLQIRRLWAVIALMFLAGTARSQTLATLTDLGTTAPTPGTYDIVQFSSNGDAGMPDGLNYYTDNYPAHGGGAPGQTFTTGSSATAYFLNSVTLKTGGGTSSGTGTAQSYILNIYSVSGSSATLLQSYGANNFTFNDGDWLQWNGLNLQLASNSVYAYCFSRTSTGTGWDAMANGNNNPYAGGELALVPAAGGTITFGSSHGYDAVFDLGLTLSNIPPSLAVVRNIAASGIQANAAGLNGQIISTGGSSPQVTIYYGQTNGATTAGGWANSVTLGTQTGTFGSVVSGLMTNTTYYFTASASNSAGISWAAPSLSFSTLASNPVPTRVPVLTYHYDNTRQGQNTNETLLTPANVNSTTFGKLFSYPVDGAIYGEPLIMTNVTIPGKGVHDVVLVETEHDSVYAFDSNDTNAGLLWQTNLGISAVMPNNDFGNRYGAYHDLVPEVGATGTPVIDPATGTIYLDAFTHEGTNIYYHRIHALDVTTGQERSYSPVVVTASVPGTGVEGNGSVVTFVPELQLQRPAMTLVGGTLYVTYGSYADTDPYHGWILAYNATNLVRLTNGIFCTTPNATVAAFGANAGEGAIWMGGNGLSVDSSNYLYFETANGSFQNTNALGPDYADSFVKLSTKSGLSVKDYFTPNNQAALQSADEDLGSGGPLLLPDSVGSTNHPHLIVGAGKEGKIYLVDRDQMTTGNLHYNTNGNDSQIVQSSASGTIGSAFESPAYFNNLIFYQGDGDVMKSFKITNGTFNFTPASESSTSFGYHGSTPVISANGTNNAIAWVIQADAYSSAGPAVLHAYNATNLAQELYNSSQNLTRDNPGAAVKFTVPTVAGGKVYVGTAFALSVFGVQVFLNAPIIAPNGGAFTNSVMISLMNTSPGASIYYTLDRSAPTASSILYTGPFILTTNALVRAVAIESGAINSGIASASFVNTAATGTGTGLLGQYYPNTFTTNAFAGSPLVRTDAVINFNWSTNPPMMGVGLSNYTVKWTGSIKPQFDETYTLYTTADDGVRLYVNGQLLINDWVNQTATTRSASLPLVDQQLYSIEMDYYQYNSNAVAELAWSSPSTPLSVIPQTQLYPYTNPAPTVVLTGPATNPSYTGTASVTLSAEADAPYNPINVVNFYANNSFLGGVSNVPYTLTTTGLSAGSYALTAVAVDGSGLSNTSAPINIVVAAGSGQPYGLTTNGPVPAFFNMPTTFNGPLPVLLSQTGVFANTPNMTPVSGLIPYVPNTPLWSDGALKARYLAVPNNGGVITTAEQIAFAPTGIWTFPAGTVFVKTFSLNTDLRNPAVIQRLETRLLVRDINDQVYGVTYKWRPDNSDADLLTNSLTQSIVITNVSGSNAQTWYYPSPADCLTCHTPVANYVLGVNTRQLNNSQTYPSTGVTDNEIRTLNRLGLLNPAINEAGISNYDQLSALTNLNSSLQQRARSYLDANCAQCHQPGGTGITFDARYDTPLTNQNIINYPASFSLGYDNVHIVTPDDVWRSAIYDRINTLDTTNATKIQMPPLARNVIDTNAVAVLAAWINSLPGVPAEAPPVLEPNGGNFVGMVNVTMMPPDTNAAIYYTLDGSLPTTNSARYEGTILLTNGSTTVSANTWENGYANSVAASALFVVQPLYFSSEGFTNHSFQLQFAGATGSNYVLEATTNFSIWNPLSTNTAPANVFNLSDPGASNFPFRFYRIIQQ
jgi:hypothetical protein